MKIIQYVIFTILLSCNLCIASGIQITAKDLGIDLIVKDFNLDYASTVKGNGSYQSKFFYISKYQIVGVTVKNNSNKILNVNPNYFTLVSNMKRSYPYSSQTHGFKDRVSFVGMDPIQAVDVYPGTDTEGFLLFEKDFKDEKPKTLYFKNHNSVLSVGVMTNK